MAPKSRRNESRNNESENNKATARSHEYWFLKGLPILSKLLHGLSRKNKMGE